MNRHYVFKARWKRALARGVDALGALVAKPSKPVSLRPNSRLLVIRLDHLGDVIATLPLLKALKSGASSPFVAMSVGSQGAQLLRDTADVDELLVFDAPWFRRSYTGESRTSAWQWPRDIRTKRFDAALELRGDARHHALLAMAGVPYRVGYGITGGGFLLQSELPWNDRAHAIEKNLAFLKELGFPEAADPTPHLNWRARPEEIEWLQKTVSRLPKPWMALHIDAGTPSKRWPLKHFAELVKRLDDTPVVLVGATHAAYPPLLDNLARAKGLDLTGKTTLPQLVTLLQASSAVVSADSGPAHIAAALGKPVVVLWSGSIPVESWAPRGNDVHVIRSESACPECTAQIVNSPHRCMDALTVDRVLPVLTSLSTKEVFS